MPKPKVIALVWAPHEARTEAFAEWLGAPLYNIHFLQAKRPLLAPLRYLLQWLKTWYILFKVRPDYVFVTNSPPVAGLCTLFYCLLTKTRFVLDTHPPGLFNRKWRWSRPVQRFTARFASLNVVDQERFRRLFESWGARAIVLENPPKTIPYDRLERTQNKQQVAFTYVGTFADDEPVDILIEAARQLPAIKLYILGDKSRAKREWVSAAPTNVEFTGYLLKDSYWNRLYNSCAVIVLTTHANSLLGGAQDGLAVGRPLILSDQETLREYFVKGSVFIDNSVAGAVAGIQRVLLEEERLEGDIQDLREELSERWQANFRQLKNVIDGVG